ncbi:LPS translocon maturation chaperone LptM [Agaricicola taiwanensis]|uniref:LPS translocon maturation chaperone LptM n=1 Tax=Agaricicola taiwanensis TaxID=591372 RepID=UPI001E5D6B45|nr:lipoprotein [Agaricicola taiwanensis]
MTGVHSAVVIVALALALSGCGRKGPLEPPPGAPAAAVVTPAPGEDDDGIRPSASLQRPTDSGAADQGPLLDNVARPDRPFLLDPLL